MQDAQHGSDSSSGQTGSHWIGQVLAGSYRILSLLGEGATGAVYIAEHVQLQKHVALKLLHASITASGELVGRFQREAVAAANIEHPNIALATDFGQLEDGSFFLVLELVKGHSLRVEVERGPLPVLRALHIIRQVFLALIAAHEKGFVHRDIKPENIMLAEVSGMPDFVKVLDFGIAKAQIPGPHSGQLTQAGVIFGTPDYMPPEQISGATVDARADLYAVGGTLFELLCGHAAFQGPPILVMAKHLTDPVPPLEAPASPSMVTARLDAFVRRLMAKNRDERPASAREALSELDSVVAELQQQNTQTSQAASAFAQTVRPDLIAPKPSPFKKLITELNKVGASQPVLIAIQGKTSFPAEEKLHFIRNNQPTLLTAALAMLSLGALAFVLIISAVFSSSPSDTTARNKLRDSFFNLYAEANAAPAETQAQAMSAVPSVVPSVIPSVVPSTTTKEGKVKIQCSPSCDSVTINGERIKDTSTPITLPPGAHSVMGAKVGYQPAHSAITVSSAEDQEVTLQLKSLTPTAGGGGKSGSSKNCSKFFKTCK